MFKHSFALHFWNNLEQVTSSGLNTDIWLPKHRQPAVLTAGQPAASPGLWLSHLPSLLATVGHPNCHWTLRCRHTSFSLSLSCSLGGTVTLFASSVLIPASFVRIYGILLADSGHICTVLILAEVSRHYYKTNYKEQ